MKFEHTDVWGFEHAIRGMRNPMDSWGKSDSLFCKSSDELCPICEKRDAGKCTDGVLLGDNDLDLMSRLHKAGSEHRKFMRQIFVSVDITAPLYWWKEFDTYQVGTTKNSCSTMHKIHSYPITIDCFETDDYHKDLEVIEESRCNLNNEIGIMIGFLELLRRKYIETNDKRYWKELIRWLPESWLQKRTVTMNYENIYNICTQRENHKLSEWSVSFMKWAKSLPYADHLIFVKKDTSAK